jgi:hypothetical protein
MCSVRCLTQLALAFPRQPFQHVPCANAAAGELRALPHEAENGVFSLGADDGQTVQVDYQFPTF